MLKSPSLDLLGTLPQKLTDIYQSASSLSPMDSSVPITLVDPGKQPWETSKTGYANWAVGQLVKRTKMGPGEPSEKGNSRFDVLSAKVQEIGDADELRGLVSVSENVDAEEAQSISHPAEMNDE